mmetsp:Transcript_35941/g.94228  ORF Transcript_35941/g.94228 Transcript_35941/m.94228 type:complete len:252 (-) Transcript_35941:310-1065(-)
MASRNFTPVNQIRLTNVAYVRLKKGGKRFELACYKNKVMSWRKKEEVDLDEVLQTHTVFTNVSKGQVANRKDLFKCFGTDDDAAIVLEILNKGQLQVSKEEREKSADQLFTEIANTVAARCVNPDTSRPYTIAQIERAMKDIHYSVQPAHSAKKQALEVEKQLRETIPIERAQMRLQIRLPKANAKPVKAKIEPLIAQLESEEWAGDLELECLVDPGNYRMIDEVVSEQTKGRGAVAILETRAIDDHDLAL